METAAFIAAASLAAPLYLMAIVTKRKAGKWLRTRIRIRNK